jgi:hypothetical protein
MESVRARSKGSRRGIDMTKLRAFWPWGFNSANAAELKNIRPSVVGADGMVNMEAAARIRAANNMMGKIERRIIEGEEVTRLMVAWEDWVAMAR